MVAELESQLTKLLEGVIDTLRHPDAFPKEKILSLATELLVTFTNGNKVAFVGNGGSAKADALKHICL